MKQLENVLEGDDAESNYSSDSYYDSEDDDYDSMDDNKEEKKDNDMNDEEGKDDEEKIKQEIDEIDEFETKVSDELLMFQIELKSAIDLLKTPINKVDEFDAFNATVRNFANVNQQTFAAILKLMTPQQNDQLKSLLRTKRVSLQTEEKKVEQEEPADEGALNKQDNGPVVARKFFKPKRTVPSNNA